MSIDSPHDGAAPGTAAAPPPRQSRLARFALGGGCLLVATIVWLPIVHCFFKCGPSQYSSELRIPPRADQLVLHQLHAWKEAELRVAEVNPMRAANPEWDLMGRMYLVLSLGNLALRDAERTPGYLVVVDQMIDQTLREERELGMYYFLMPYAREGAFLQKPQRSHFVDSEIAMMLAARRTLAENAAYRAEFQPRAQMLIERMQKSPVLMAESYPDECWLFCNTLALAAVRMGDRLDGTDHSEFFRNWVASAKAKLIEPNTGILISACTWDGETVQGPEGSSIWMAAHCLQLIDPDFAADQYARARREIGRTVLGFGYAREWPVSWKAGADVDSGPIIPGLDVSAGASGQAFVAASAFHDRDYLADLFTTLDFAAFPMSKDGGLKYCASNQVGDAVLLYSTVLGPLWEKAKSQRAESEPTR